MDTIYDILPFPKEIIDCIIGYLDIDSRIKLGIPPKRLTKERYIPLERLAFPIYVNYDLTILRLSPTLIYIGKIIYKYQRIRRFCNYMKNDIVEETILEHVGSNENIDAYQKYSGWNSLDFVKFKQLG
jgi:hypothetical protein